MVSMQDGNLVIDGLTGACNVRIDASNPNNVLVYVNSGNPASGGPFAVSPDNRVIVNGSTTGSDTVTFSGACTSEIHGGPFGDAITVSSSADSVIYGNGNHDTIVMEGSGNYVAISGLGRNTLYSNSFGSSILVGDEVSSTATDPVSGLPIRSFDFLHQAAEGWAAGDQSGVVAIQGACTPKTGSIANFDTLTGGNGKCAFLAHVSGAGIKDNVSNYNPSHGDIVLNV